MFNCNKNGKDNEKKTDEKIACLEKTLPLCNK